MPTIQKTLVLLKPDAVQRDLLGEVIQRFERKGIKIVATKMVQLTDAILEEHYAHIVAKPFFPSVKAFMQQTPVIAMVLEGWDVIEEVRKIVGVTDPRQAAAGTIRADLSMNKPSNLVHASDAPETAEVEIKRFFADGEVFSYKKVSDCYTFGEGV